MAVADIYEDSNWYKKKCITASCSNGITWFKTGMHLNGVSCGLMAMLCNSKSPSLGIMSVSILASLKVGCWFGRGHGKGPCDGAGVVVRKFLCQEQLKTYGGKFTNATKVFRYLKPNLSSFRTIHALGRINL